MPTYASLAAQGGITVSQRNHQVGGLLSNPALMNTEMDRHLTISYIPYYANIRYSSVAYAQQVRQSYWGMGLQYLNYGTFEATDPTGLVIGQFKAQEYALSVSHSHTIEQYTLGASLKVAGSNLANYSAYAVLADIGGIFKHPAYDWTVGLLFKNVGFVFKDYTATAQSTAPFDVQVGTTIKPKFMPLRFSVTAHHLHRFNIAYDDPALQTQIDQNGNEEKSKVSVVDKVARHFVVGTELQLGKSFRLQGGYNHLIRQELKIAGRARGSGFSLGAALWVRAFELAYARAWNHAAGGISYFTLSGNLKEITIKKKTQQQ
jgi:hypothetical protein